jgi:ABC-type microcin C transport system permease subunit YejB
MPYSAGLPSTYAIMLIAIILLIEKAFPLRGMSLLANLLPPLIQLDVFIYIYEAHLAAGVPLHGTQAA